MEIICDNLAQLPSAARQVIEYAQPHQIWAFEGVMGAGKTTLIKEICRQLGVTDMVSSPTFSLVNEYQSATHIIYHFDFYRIENEEEVMDMGYEEYFYHKEAYCFLEWASLIPNLIPPTYIQIKLHPQADQQRLLQLNKYE
ncbi:MAG: tRNA (adenosine(37)-N6)-threonylcarbamoyltransferase complex ATPase subunit type 1 TsaE [Thermonemataceae bacterium]